MKRKSMNKKKQPGERHVFIKLFNNHAEVSVLWTNDLQTAYAGLYNFTDREHTMHNFNVLAVGQVYWSEHYKTYYGTYTKVRHDYQDQGHGDYLYKAMILAAKTMAKKEKKRKCYFSPHSAAGNGTSNSAWRCYKALARKGYLKPTKGVANVNSKFEVIKVPKIIKPTFLNMEAA